MGTYGYSEYGVGLYGPIDLITNWNISGEVVGSGSAPSSWATLDLSSEVGSQRAMVWLDLSTTGGEGPSVGVYAFRPYGDTDDWYDDDNSDSRGCCNVYYNATEDNSGIFVLTDDQGRVEWHANGAADVTITLIGFIDNVETPGYENKVSTGALDAGWNDIDCSDLVGETKAFVFLKVIATNAWASGEYWFTRPYGDSANWINTESSVYGAANKLNKADLDDAFGLIGLTDTTGTLQIYSELGTGQADIELLAYVDTNNGWTDPIVGEEIVFPAASAPTTYTDLDLSDAIGIQRAFVVLKVRQTGGTTSAGQFRFRENGTSYDHEGGAYSSGCVDFKSNRAGMVIVPCDENGVIEWEGDLAKTIEITVIGYIPTNVPVPTIVELIPGYLSLRVVFDQEMIDDPELVNPDNYTIIANESGAIDVASVISVTKEPDVDNPTYVDLEVQDLTDGKQYKLTITSGVLSGVGGSLVSPNNVAYYMGDSELPAIQTLRSLSATEVEITFTKLMSPNSDLIDTSRYSFDKSLRVLEVTIVSPGIVKLKTSKQIPSEMYTLTVS